MLSIYQRMSNLLGVEEHEKLRELAKTNNEAGYFLNDVNMLIASNMIDDDIMYYINHMKHQLDIKLHDYFVNDNAEMLNKIFEIYKVFHPECSTFSDYKDPFNDEDDLEWFTSIFKI